MSNKKYHIHLTKQEQSKIIQSLIYKKNILIAQGKHTDTTHELICKISKANKKTFRVRNIS